MTRYDRIIDRQPSDLDDEEYWETVAYVRSRSYRPAMQADRYAARHDAPKRQAKMILKPVRGVAA